MVNPPELPNVLNGVFEKYAVNESAIFRYAKRRGVDSDRLGYAVSYAIPAFGAAYLLVYALFFSRSAR